MCTQPSNVYTKQPLGEDIDFCKYLILMPSGTYSTWNLHPIHIGLLNEVHESHDLRHLSSGNVFTLPPENKHQLTKQPQAGNLLSKHALVVL